MIMHSLKINVYSHLKFFLDGLNSNNIYKFDREEANIII